MACAGRMLSRSKAAAAACSQALTSAAERPCSPRMLGEGLAVAHQVTDLRAVLTGNRRRRRPRSSASCPAPRLAARPTPASPAPRSASASVSNAASRPDRPCGDVEVGCPLHPLRLGKPLGERDAGRPCQPMCGLSSRVTCESRQERAARCEGRMPLLGSRAVRDMRRLARYRGPRRHAADDRVDAARDRAAVARERRVGRRSAKATGSPRSRVASKPPGVVRSAAALSRVGARSGRDRTIQPGTYHFETATDVARMLAALGGRRRRRSRSRFRKASRCARSPTSSRGARTRGGRERSLPRRRPRLPARGRRAGTAARRVPLPRHLSLRTDASSPARSLETMVRRFHERFDADRH